MSNTMIDALEAGAKWGTLTLSEQIAARAIARRLVAMATDGASAEDWQQLAGYDKWAQHPDALKAAKPTLTVAGHWVDWRGGSFLPALASTRVDIQYRSGRVTKNISAGAVYWQHTGHTAEVIAYRIAD